MLGEKIKSSVIPPPPPSTAKDGDDVVRSIFAEADGAFSTFLESPKEEDMLYKTPTKEAANGDDANGCDDDEEKNEDANQEEGENGNEDNVLEMEDGVADAVEEEMPKLAKGFYIIEAVRKKRIRKGKPEYFIKWRGWPETANTWEPWANVKTCPDLIAAFEQSLLLSKRSRTRKRTRNNNYSRSKTRKKQHKPSPIIEDTIPSVVTVTDTHSAVLNSGVTKDAQITDLEAVKLSNLNGVDFAPSENELTEIRNNEEEEILVEHSHTETEEAQLTGQNGVANGSEKTESVQAGRFTGSRRRKTGPVRRFILDPNSSGTGLDGDQMSENPDLTSNNVGCKDTKYISKNICDVTEIIKPMKYTSFMTCNTLDICVTFLVKRSDGKEMTVDNKFLKSHCPLLLLDFYEQRLQYKLAELTVG